MNKFLNQESEHKARKRFGQNFLTDHGVINGIVRAIAPAKNDLLVEIGPGKGAITELLADQCDHLRVIELDRDLVPWLKVKFEKHPDFQLFQADALRFDFASLLSPEYSSLRVDLCWQNSRHAFHVAKRSGETHGRLARRKCLRAFGYYGAIFLSGR
jgi:16S rRNA A1518/A1519 N6-dimethyltransferase RsmA/KsgA/DIM1 with predicted DNA glycosylase/AP lyase activity